MPDSSAAKPDADAEAASAATADASRGMTLFVLIVATLYFGKEVLVPITLALLLAFVLAPLVALLRRLRLGRVPAVLLAVLTAISLVLALGGVIGSQLAQLTNSLPQYAATVEQKVDNVRDATIGRLSRLTDRIGNRAGPPADDAPTSTQVPASPPRAPAPNAQQAATNPLTFAERYLSPILSPLATFGIVFVVAIFALLQQEDLRDRLIRLFGSTDMQRTTVAMDDGGRRLSRYFLTQLCIKPASAS